MHFYTHTQARTCLLRRCSSQAALVGITCARPSGGRRTWVPGSRKARTTASALSAFGSVSDARTHLPSQEGRSRLDSPLSSALHFHSHSPSTTPNHSYCCSCPSILMRHPSYPVSRPLTTQTRHLPPTATAAAFGPALATAPTASTTTNTVYDRTHNLSRRSVLSLAGENEASEQIVATRTLLTATRLCFVTHRETIPHQYHRLCCRRRDSVDNFRPQASGSRVSVMRRRLGQDPVT